MTDKYAGLLERLRLGTKVKSDKRGCPEYRSTALEREAAEAISSLLEALRFAEVSLEGVTPPTMAGADIALRHVRAVLNSDAPLSVGEG